MKLLKGCIVIILLIILANSVTASFLKINLTRNKVSLGQNFDGYMKFNLTQPALQDSKFLFHVNEKTYEVKLENVLKNKEVQKLPPEYKKEGASASTISIDFSKNDTKVNAALDLSAKGRNHEGVAVSSLQFDITGEQLNGKLPSDVTIDLGNDKSKEYRYQSNIFKGYKAGDRSYLGDNSLDSSVFIRGGDIFCQKATLTPSKKYQVKTQVASLVSGAQLGMSITEEILSGIPDCTIEKCCTVSTLSSTTKEASCTIEKDVPDEANYSICAYALGEEYGTNYFKLAVDTDETKINGYANGNEVSEDYFIYADYGEFDNTLSGTARVEINPDIVNSYIQGGNCGNNCLLIPLSISSKTAGRIKLSNIALNYEYDGVARELNSLQKISSIPERLNYTKTVNVELSSLNNVVAPAEKRTDNELYAEIDTGEEKLTSNRIRFDSLEGPKPYIRYGPATAKPGIAITFDASNTTTQRDREIEKYEWDFGDGGKAEGIEAKHTYVNASTYLVILKATDTEGLTGTDRIVIIVTEGTGIDNEINSTLQAISNLRAKIEKGSAQLKDSTEQIGINILLSSSETNITQIRNKKDTILENANLTETQKNQQLGLLINNLAEIKESIPADIIVDVTTFNPKALSLNDIPSEVADDIDTRKAILKAQSGISVNGEARAINLLYPDGRIENKIFVKKTISGTGIVYEVLPFGTAVKEVITPSEYNFTSSNVLKLSGITSLSYIMEGVLFNALSTKTIIVPSTLKVEKTGEKEQIESQCGDNICDYSQENSESCPEDCKPQRPLWIVGLIALAITLIVYFGLFFKGGVLNRLLIKKPGRSFFTNEKDYLAVKNYVKEAKKKGLKDKQIKEALKTKHWKEEQIKGVLNDIKEEEKKVKKLAKKLSKKIKS